MDGVNLYHGLCVRARRSDRVNINETGMGVLEKGMVLQGAIAPYVCSMANLCGVLNAPHGAHPEMNVGMICVGHAHALLGDEALVVTL